MSRKIYLIRHGRPEGDGQSRYLGRTDVPLSAEGRGQAARLGEALQGANITAVYSSPLRRCMDTAACLGRPVTAVPGLAEIDLGTWEGRLKAEIKALYPEEYAARGRDLEHFAPPGGECFAQVAQRALAALRTILAESRGDIAVVAHAGVNRALLCRLTGRPLGELFDIPQSYCGVILLEAEGNRITWLQNS